ncbi:aspartyl-phosphate phosphatase Spo0E family protein [Brevibacillus invocatus]
MQIRRVGQMTNKDVLLQIEQLRKELNDRYREQSSITPELVELSVQLDHLLNKLQLRP